MADNFLKESIKIDVKISDEIKVSNSLEKLSERVIDLTDNFSSLQKLLNKEIGIKDFVLGIDELGNKMTTLEKGVVGVTAVFTEFTQVKDGIYGLVSGTENFVVSLGKVAGSAAIASAALYASFGPAGLVVSGLTIVTAAILGVAEAMNEMVDESIGNAIFETLTKPGGISLDEIYQQYAGTMSQIGNCFSELTSRTEVLEEADSNIRDTWLEIEKIEIAMDAGVLSVEEGSAKLKTLFGELAEAASQKFGELETTLLLAFGENGVLSEVFNELGYSAQDTITMVVGLNDQVKEEIKRVEAELADLDPYSEEYAKQKAYLMSLTNDTDALTQAMQKYESLINEMGEINYNDFFGDDGALDSQAVENYLNSISTATSDAQAAVSEAMEGIKNALITEMEAAKNIGNDATAEALKERINAIPEATELLKSDIAEKAKGLTDTIQTELIGGINDTIGKAQEEWGEFNWLEKLGFKMAGGPSTEDEFVKKAIEKYVGDVGAISDEIEKSLTSMGEEGAGWARETGKKILGELFNSEYYYGDMGVGGYVYTLKDNFSEIISSGLEMSEPVAYEAAADIGANGINQGTADGMVENTRDIEDAAVAVSDAATESTEEKLEMNSPSKVFKRIGKAVVDGLNLGIVGNVESTTITMGNYTQAIKDSFSGMPLSFFTIAQTSMQRFIEGLASVENILYSKVNNIARNITLNIKSVLGIETSSNVMFEFGVNTINGFIEGLSSLENELYNKVNTIADNVKSTLQASLEIHSPSKVMFELGTFTMEGFLNGLESMYESTYSSLRKFSYNTVQPTVSYTGEGINYASHDIFKEHINTNENAYANAIISYLVQIAQNTREGAHKEFSINIGDRDIARANSRGQRSLGRKIMAEI